MLHFSWSGVRDEQLRTEGSADPTESYAPARGPLLEPVGDLCDNGGYRVSGAG